MYQLSTGAAKAGKTALLVHKAAELKKEVPDLFVVSNIKGHKADLNFSEWTTDLVIAEFGYTEHEMVHLGRTPFMEVNNKFPVLLLVDEAQRYFNNSYSRQYPINIMSGIEKAHGAEMAERFKKGIPQDTYFFFEYHAHLNYTIFLATHNVRTLPQRLLAPAEMVNVCQRSSKRLMGNITYFMTDDGRVSKESPKQKFSIKSVKDEYVSSEHGQAVKPNNVLLKLAPAFVFFAVLATLGVMFISDWYSDRSGEPEPQQATVAKVDPVSDGFGQPIIIDSPQVVKPKTDNKEVDRLEARLNSLQERISADVEDCYPYAHGKLCRDRSGRGEGISRSGEWYRYYPVEQQGASTAPP